MRVNCECLPNNMRTHCNLDSKATNLKQAAKLAHDYLRASLEPYMHEPIPDTVGLWWHKTRPTKFCLYVDDFGF